MSNFATRLKELREQMNLSQPELARRLGLSHGAIGNYEAGTRTPRKLEDLEAISDFFNVDLSYLLGHTDTKPEYSLEENWIIECYRNITCDTDREVIKTLLRKYDPAKKADSLSSAV